MIPTAPLLSGNHRVLVEYAGVPIGGSPYHVQVYDASLVKVSQIAQGFIGKPVTFSCKLNFLLVFVNK